MAKAKEKFEKMIEVQQGLMDKVAENTTRVMGMFALDEGDAREGRELMDDFFRRNQELVEENMQPEKMEKLWEHLPEQYQRSMDLQMDFYNRSAEFTNRLIKKYTVQNPQDQLKKMTDIYLDTYNAWMETSRENLKAFQNFFNN
jgi:hypothetical protein